MFVCMFVVQTVSGDVVVYVNKAFEPEASDPQSSKNKKQKDKKKKNDKMAGLPKIPEIKVKICLVVHCMFYSLTPNVHFSQETQIYIDLSNDLTVTFEKNVSYINSNENYINM